VGSGCVIVTCHTPWKRLLVEWCLENDFALIVSRSKWTFPKRRIQRQGRGISELRDMINLLKQNGRIIIAADIFNNLENCPVTFNGNSCNASLFPVRLARIAKVPLVVAIPAYRDGIINIDPRWQFDFKPPRSDGRTVMQKIIAFLDGEIKKDPCIWSLYVKGHY
jgi:lauroyl/myristoyl acyltransferase